MQKFEQYAEALRQLGNLRKPYVMFIDESLDRSKLSIGEDLACKQQDFFLDKHTDVEYITSLLDNTALIVRLFGEKSLLDTPIALLANEVQVAGEAPKFFKLHKQTDACNIYLQQLIDTPDIAAFVAKSDATLCSKIFGIDIMPWHTCLVNKASGEAVIVIWDTREILAYASKANCPDFDLLLNLKNANDNSMMLFDTKSILPANTGFDKYTIYKL